VALMKNEIDVHDYLFEQSFDEMILWLSENVGPVIDGNHTRHTYTVNGKGWKYEYMQYECYKDRCSRKVRIDFANRNFKEQATNDKFFFFSKRVHIEDDELAVLFKLSF
jgi:hypothetical protein